VLLFFIEQIVISTVNPGRLSRPISFFPPPPLVHLILVRSTVNAAVGWVSEGKRERERRGALGRKNARAASFTYKLAPFKTATIMDRVNV
jgi:hypothetical protein